MTLEKTGPVQFKFWVKKTKKKIGVAKVTYDLASDQFAEAGEAASLAMPNKIIYLERDQLARLTALYPQRQGLDLKGLLVLIFKNFSFASSGFALHYLRAYHLVDILRRTAQEDVEFTLLNASEFEKSDKKKGLFFFREAVPVKVVAPPVAVAEVPAAVPTEIEEAEEIPSIEFTVLAEAPPEVTPEARAEAEAIAEAEAELEAFEAEKKPKEEKPAAAPAKKEKKKIKLEADRRPRTRKSERRVLEEEIAQEEGEREALYAEKGADEEAAEGAALAVEPETRAEAPAEEVKPAGPGPLGAFGGMFAEKLKLAIKKKREETAKPSDEADEPDKP
jgi:hypothetical protein